MALASRRGRRYVALAACLVLLSSAASAQFGRFRRYELASPKSFDGAFQFCRVWYRGAANGDGGDWQVDFPRADSNLMTRLSELTKTSISRLPDGEPNHVIIRLTQPELFKCPFIMMTEVGNIFLDEDEAKALREYLLKGGFLWADDFWGEYAWSVWDNQFRKVLPTGAYPYHDLTLDHPLFRQFFTMSKFPQIPSIGMWYNLRGGTSERGIDSRVPHPRAVLDDRGRIMALITHNTDFGDSFEEEATDRQYFLRFSVDGYAFGINALIYAMSH
jgi:Domain of unknown function (DUF4159)